MAVIHISGRRLPFHRALEDTGYKRQHTIISLDLYALQISIMAKATLQHSTHTHTSEPWNRLILLRVT